MRVMMEGSLLFFGKNADEREPFFFRFSVNPVAAAVFVEGTAQPRGWCGHNFDPW